MKLRLRVTRLLVLPAALVALVSDSVYSEGAFVERSIRLCGLILLVFAAGGRIWASAYVAGKKNRSLVTDGPFSLVRNPLYFFSFVGFVGAGLSFGSVTIAGLFALTFFAAHWPTIQAEERALEELFGEAYRSYRQKVPRFVPALRRPAMGGVIDIETAGFSTAVAESTAIPLVFAVAELARWAQLNGWLPILFTFP